MFEGGRKWSQQNWKRFIEKIVFRSALFPSDTAGYRWAKIEQFKWYWCWLVEGRVQRRDSKSFKEDRWVYGGKDNRGDGT